MKITLAPTTATAANRFGDMTVTTWKGIPVIRRFKKPANPKTTSQRWTRVSFANLCKLYLTGPSWFLKAWENAALDLDVTPRNLWLKENVPLAEFGPDILRPQFSPGDPGALPPATWGAQAFPTYISFNYAAPTPPIGYTFKHLTGCCIHQYPPQGPIDPSVILIHEAAKTSPSSYLIISFDVTPGIYYLGAFCRWTNAQGKSVYSRANKFAVTL